MRKALLAIAVPAVALLMAACSTLPPWKSAPSGQQAEYGSIEADRDLIRFFAFSDDPGISAMAFQKRENRDPARYALLLDGPALGAMRAALDKYEDWKNVARENRTEIAKAIAVVGLGQIYHEDGRWHNAGDREIELVFTSRIDSNGTQTFYLTLKPSPLYLRRAFFRVYSPDAVVLTDGRVKMFSRLISEDALDEGYQKAKKKQDVIDTFN